MSERSWWRRWFRRGDARGYPGEVPDGVVGEAALAGWQAALAGQYDEWSFAAADDIPYLVRLEKAEGVAVLETKLEAEQEILEIRRRYKEASDDSAAQKRIADEEEEWLRAERDRFAARRDITQRQLDRIAGVHAPMPPDYDPELLPSQQPPVDLEAEASLPVTPGQWPGPADGTLSPPVPPWFKLTLVGLLAAVELPIYFESFHPFHRDPGMVLLFTVPVALSMVLGPHLTGVWLRGRKTEPSPGRLPAVISACIMAVWFGATVVLAVLRRNALLAPETFEGQTIPPDLGDLDPTTVTVVFGLLLVMSGLIAFMLGLADDHPGVAAMREAHEAAAEMADAHLDAVAAQAQAHHDGLLQEDEEVEAVRRERDERVDAITLEYQEARAAYLDAVALALADPSVTQATSTAVNEKAPQPGRLRRFWRQRTAPRVEDLAGGGGSR